MEKKRIAVFDSGVGGLTVVSELRKALPEADYFYLGDSARAPYGIKTEETILRYAFESLDFLMQFEPDAIVVACNSVSSVALDKLLSAVSVPLIETVQPVSAQAVAATQTGSLLLLGTPATLRSGSYLSAVKRIDASVEVTGKACPLFVPLVEEGLFSGPVVESVLDLYLSSYREHGADTVILGCTHYPFLSAAIEQYFQNQKNILCCGGPMASRLTELFPPATGEEQGALVCFTTDPISPFNRIATTLLNDRCECSVVALSEKFSDPKRFTRGSEYPYRDP